MLDGKRGGSPSLPISASQTLTLRPFACLIVGAPGNAADGA
jgi:hypothetical protein